MSLIHERDVVDVAVHVLTTAGHGGAMYPITRLESIIQAKLAMIIGEAAGGEVRSEDLPLEQARQPLTAAWGNADFVEARLKAWEGFGRSPERVTGAVERLLGRPARTFRSWRRSTATTSVSC